MSHCTLSTLVLLACRRSPSYDFLAGLINGTLPLPTPIPSAPCAVAPDTDVQETNGYEVDATTQDACCAACNADVKCERAAFDGNQCWIKYWGGITEGKSGVVLLTPQR